MKSPFSFDAKISLTGRASSFGTDLFLTLIGITLIICAVGVVVYLWKQPNLKRRIKRILPKRMVQPLAVVAQANHQWALDFMHDTGKPQQNGFVERFNGFLRREFLNAYLFESLTQVREIAWFWQVDDNEERIHESLGHLPPAAYRA